MKSGFCACSAYFRAAFEDGSPIRTAASIVALTIKGSNWGLVTDTCIGNTMLRIIALASMDQRLEGV